MLETITTAKQIAMFHSDCYPLDTDRSPKEIHLTILRDQRVRRSSDVNAFDSVRRPAEL